MIISLDKKFKLLVLPALLILFAILILLNMEIFEKSKVPMSDFELADALIQKVAIQHGQKPLPLGDKSVVSYGTLQFQYIADSQEVEVAILAAEDELWNKLGSEFEHNYLKSKTALNDPKIGGMFDSAEGLWRFEPQTGRTYLYRSYSLQTPPQEIVRDIEAMSEVVPAWETRWGGVVAEISQGITPPPTEKVTLEHDPYAGRF